MWMKLPLPGREPRATGLQAGSGQSAGGGLTSPRQCGHRLGPSGRPGRSSPGQARHPCARGGTTATHARSNRDFPNRSGRGLPGHAALQKPSWRRSRSNSHLTDAEIERYLLAEQPYDCAGSAKSEGLGIALLERIDNDDPTALVGLPLIRTCRLLRAAGLKVL